MVNSSVKCFINVNKYKKICDNWTLLIKNHERKEKKLPIDFCNFLQY